jgi:hypothetical protein
MLAGSMAAPDDEFLLSASQIEVAVGVLPAEVASIQPLLVVAEIQPEPLFLMGVAISGKHIGAADRERANLADGAIAHIVAHIVQHDSLHLLQRHSQPDGPVAPLTEWRIACADAGSLGQPIPLENLQPR